MKRIYSVLVENRSGVLCKVAGLFSRRCYNIDSLVVGETDDPTVSCMTIVSSGDQRTIEQIEKQLNKKLDVIKVRTFDENNSIRRELMFVKVKYNRNNRRDIMVQLYVKQLLPFSQIYKGNAGNIIVGDICFARNGIIMQCARRIDRRRAYESDWKLYNRILFYYHSKILNIIYAVFINAVAG